MSAPVAASSATAPPIDVSNLFSVKGLVALITGGGSGIGLMMTQSLASAGAKRIYIAGRRLSVLRSAAHKINSSLPQNQNPNQEPVVVPLECDVTSPSSLSSLVSSISSDPYTGYLNLLVCNAGVGGPQVSVVDKETGQAKSLSEFRQQALAVDFDKEWEQTFRVNVGSVWYTSMACLELLEKGNTLAAQQQQEGQGQGQVVWRESASQIVVTSSIAALNKAAPGGWAYGVSKAAATHVGKQLATLLPRWGIRCNVICPGRKLLPPPIPVPFRSDRCSHQLYSLPLRHGRSHRPSRWRLHDRWRCHPSRQEDGPSRSHGR
ncbi:short chain dehydrogenase/reductase, variant 2 [Neurospora crassa OR74A]|uniref:Short chain dehydrogenase/reductase, variant 2 n=1 Tax=Neurospora crassa (strain ATCC 24698 / 74-OR23-1A / CBS 708.71 / DSM 1257 / FGSC 987) TaxID=367110 RepID=V5IN14_NEUCR|nr:short chain dehydrogenase/reductase, variant 2 [Neurospora crassa OR74A]ESA42141.1 short chain dehydrogenase/reductase, variant 2 [Neurospora crassa OR74A]|eukprot:XP_011394915.1 short chain dehydrogenase/reductase, variant 2 [Neurospora crassa OR74A]